MALTRHEYNPYKLPVRMDFHRATQNLPLPRSAKTSFQIYLATRSKQEIREIIGKLEQEMHRLLKESTASLKDGHIIIPKQIAERERAEILQKAIYTKATMEFAEKYLSSLEQQRKI